MSKAFLRESDLDEDVPIVPRRPSDTEGVPNYITMAGLSALQAELKRLVDEERPTLVSRAPDREGRAAVMALNQKIWQVQERIRTAIVADGQRDTNIIQFGAEVRLRESGGAETTYRLVGADEARPEEHRISWQAPLARALARHRVGERVLVRGPRGENVVEVLSIDYPAAS